MKFDIRKLERLNDPGRLETLDPERMWDALGRPHDARTIVEIGAGTGFFARRFAALAPDSVVYAADVEDAMLEWMRDNLPEVAEERVVPLKSAETAIPLDDGIADVVYMVNLHHELDDPAAVLAEALRLLRPFGSLLVVDWADRETPKGPPLAARIPAETIAQQLRDAGFGDVWVHADILPWHSLLTARRP